MKRDMDLIRKILLVMEKDNETPHDFESDGFSDGQVGFHVYLMADAGLIDAVDASSRANRLPYWNALNIRWAGYEFLDAAKNETLWTKAKSVLVEKGIPATIGILTTLLTGFAKEKLGIK